MAQSPARDPERTLSVEPVRPPVTRATAAGSPADLIQA